MNYTKSSVKLLKVISQYENKTAFYTEFDGNFKVGDKLYIMVLNNTSTEYLLDSFRSTGTTYKSIGYELLGKEGNKLILDILYDDLVYSGITTLTENNCFIGRVYIKTGAIYSGVVNGSVLYNVTLNGPNNLSLLWYQGILAESPSAITNISFDTNTTDQLILKSEVSTDNSINSYYTVNNYDIGLSIVNLLMTGGTNLEFVNCNVNAGMFNYCDFITGSTNYISNGILNTCWVGRKYTINGGEFINCELENPTVTWNNGIWDSNFNLPPNNTGNPFKTRTWTSGTWKRGTFPDTAGWITGRFTEGIFGGVLWYDGLFGTKDSTSGNTIFSGSTWQGGDFNGGDFYESIWNGGNFYGGYFDNSTWNNGTFHDGTFLNGSRWFDGTFNNGLFKNSTWYDGIFNYGIFSGSTWQMGIFNNGGINYSTWEDGDFYNGKFENSIWEDGNFHKGSMFYSDWLNGNLFYGLMNTINWSGGTWNNGIANNVNFYGGNWRNGIFNYGYFYQGNWYDGSFNSGFFSGLTNPSDAIWYNGNFYFGEFYGTWIGGKFYTGKQTSVPQQYIIGREFVQYNKSGLYANRYNTVKLPAKKRY